MDHDSYPDDYIRDILNEVKTVAMVGASPNPVRPSYFAFKYMHAKGYRMHPVNPGHAGKTLLGRTFYASLADVPEPIDMVDIFRASEHAGGVVDAALALDPLPKVIWMQLRVRDDDAARRAEAAGIRVVMDRCPKIEYARLSGEIAWAGVNTRQISTRRPSMGAGGGQRRSIARPGTRTPERES